MHYLEENDILRSLEFHATLLKLVSDETANLWPLESATEERWGGLAGFSKAYEAGDAEFSDLLEFGDGADLGFAWGLLTAAANLENTGMDTMLLAAAELLEKE